MRILTPTLLCVLAMTLFTAAAPSTPPEGKLSGVVTDPVGAVIADAYIIVHWDPDGTDKELKSNVGLNHDLNLTRDQDGRYSADMPSGLYDVFVTARGFKPSCQKIWVTKGKEITFSPTLDVYALPTIILQ